MTDENKTPWNAQKLVLGCCVVLPVLIGLYQDRNPLLAFGWIGEAYVFFILIPYTLTCVANIFYHLRVAKGSVQRVHEPRAAGARHRDQRATSSTRTSSRRSCSTPTSFKYPDVDHDCVLRAVLRRWCSPCGRHAHRREREGAPPLLRGRRRDATIERPLRRPERDRHGRWPRHRPGHRPAFARRGRATCSCSAAPKPTSRARSRRSRPMAGARGTLHLRRPRRGPGRRDGRARRPSAGSRIDVLVNNAGIDDDTPFLEIDRARWRGGDRHQPDRRRS